jgi:hypothetical protein
LGVITFRANYAWTASLTSPHIFPNGVDASVTVPSYPSGRVVVVPLPGGSHGIRPQA